MRVFAINLHRSAERRRDLLTWLPSLALPWEIFDAVDASEWRPEAAAWHNRYWGEPLWPGAVGCYLSHRRVLQRIVDYDLPYAVILEDDATLQPGGDFRLRELLEKPPADFDCIHLHLMRGCGLCSQRTGVEDALYRVRPAMLTTTALLVSNHFARRICASDLPIDRPYDHFLRDLSRHPAARFYEMTQPAFGIGSYPSTINAHA